jgi:hypothetical protein
MNLLKTALCALALMATACVDPENRDLDSDGFTAAIDCADDDAAIHPDAIEVCDDIDNDCDGTTDVGAADGALWYPDNDGDGYGNDAAAVDVCAQPDGHVLTDGDCDDDDDAVNPDEPEACNGLDDNCDGDSDEGMSFDAWYLDGDGDGYGDTSTVEYACSPPDGGTLDGDDCDDFDNTTFPGAEEVCDNADNDCDGEIDNGADCACTLPAEAAPTTPLTCGIFMVLDAADGAPLPGEAAHCNYPAGDYQLFETVGGIAVEVSMCSGGAVVVFDANGCYGTANVGDEWSVIPLSTHAIGVTGGKYILTTEEC